MFIWQKLGKLFDPRDLNGESWMHEFAQSPSTIVLDDRVRVYFCSRPKPDRQGLYVSYIAYLDLDRNDPTRVLRVCDAPLLPLGKLGTFDEFGTNPVSAIRIGDEVRIYYAGWTRCESVPINGAIGVAVSQDGGETFKRIGPGPVIPYSPEEPFMMGSPRIRKFGDRWILFYVSGKQWIRHERGRPEPVYKIRMATSVDGIHWMKHGTDLIADRVGDDECQACADVTFRDGLYHMFFSYRHSHGYKCSAGGYRIGYARSTDMRHWSRHDELAGMTTSATGWDSQMVSYAHLFGLNEQCYMLYQGNGMGREGIGLARLMSPLDWGRP
ncbi:MAG: glycosylase [Accumulibacter sp.]|jgi:predicted GH43/DUF377 family glycosyl hydrolase|uniref:glycosylase n=1 Tax=Accumulibacter sp. TaxID=2053492 RepID=UPI002FC336BC